MKYLKNKVVYLVGILLLIAGILAGYSPTDGGVNGDTYWNEDEGNGYSNSEDDYGKLTGDDAEEDPEEKSTDNQESIKVVESGEYTSKEEVAEYLHLYEHLPDNYITKKEAKALGWVSSEGNLGEVAPGKSIGGDYFGNYEGILPEENGRDYYECDIDTDGGYRGSKRIVYSNDGLIYYTEDHYETFELLYGEE